MSGFPAFDLYTELGVAPNATKQVIIKAWKDLQRTTHPDKQKSADDKLKATEKSARLNAAKQVLCDEKQRKEYDAHREREQLRSNTGPSASDWGTSAGSTSYSDWDYSSYGGSYDQGSQFNYTSDEAPHDHPGASYDYFGRTKARASPAALYADPLEAEAPYVDPRASYNPFPGSRGSRANSGSTPPKSTAHGPKSDFIPKGGSAFPGNDSYSFNPGYAQFSPPESPTAANRNRGGKSYSGDSSRPAFKRAGTWASTAPSPATIFDDEEPSYFTRASHGRRASNAPRAGDAASQGRPPMSPRSPVPPRHSSSQQSASIPRSGHRVSISLSSDGSGSRPSEALKGACPMLGRLLNTAAASLSPAAHFSIKSSSQLESVTEEEHTSGLLFPAGSNLWRSPHNVQELPPHSRTSAYDDRGRVDLGPFRNFRVVVAQDALGDRDEPCILFDSEKHGSAASKSPAQGSLQRNSKPAVTSSTTPTTASTITTTTPHNSTRQRSKTSSVTTATPSSAFHSSAPSGHDISRFNSGGPPSARKDAADPPRPSALFSARRRNSPLMQPYRDAETTRVSSDASLLNCIFGSNAFTYRGSSTKMHLLPKDANSGDELDVTALKSSRFRHGAGGGGPTSAYGGHSIPRSGSYTFRENMESFPRESRSSHASEMTVMITRMFSINLHTDAHLSNDAQPPGLSAQPPKETKTPMFAVAITIKLPFAKAASRGGPSNSNAAQNPTSFFGASLDSDHKWGSQSLNGGPETSFPTNVDDRIDTLVEHWDSITRAMAHIEKIASMVITGLLEATDVQMRQQMKLHRNPHARNLVVTLAPNSLSEYAIVREEAARAIKRIYLALSIPRVVTGQSRWGIWREEARWVSKPLSNKEQRFFFPVLMTAFLGNHTEWIQFLGPDWHRRRRFLQHKAQKETEPILPNRTIIVSADKMTSRRLIFILSSFLPKQQCSECSQPSPNEASIQFLNRSQSPSFTSLNHRETPSSSRRYSLMKQPNSRGTGIQRFSTSVPSTNISALAAQAASNHTKPLERTTSSTLERSWASPYHPNMQRNTATATVAYAAPEASIPVAHFSHESKRNSNGITTGGDFDDESSSSLASENLLRNLKGSELSRIPGRSPQDTSGPSSRGQPRHARWDSFFSGFWSSGSSNGNHKSQQASPANRPMLPSAVQKPPRRDTGHHHGNDDMTRVEKVNHQQPPNV
ncbi:hypothetical protein KEM56_001412, partial [Ascosphaera pollenicola]